MIGDTVIVLIDDSTTSTVGQHYSALSEAPTYYERGFLDDVRWMCAVHILPDQGLTIMIQANWLFGRGVLPPLLKVTMI